MKDADDSSNSDFVDVEDVAEVGSAAVETADDSFAASKYLAFVDANDGTGGIDDVVVEGAVEDVAFNASNLARCDAVFSLSSISLACVASLVLLKPSAAKAC